MITLKNLYNTKIYIKEIQINQYKIYKFKSQVELNHLQKYKYKNQKDLKQPIGWFHTKKNQQEFNLLKFTIDQDHVNKYYQNSMMEDLSHTDVKALEITVNL